MTCCGCKSQCPTSKNGLCRVCRDFCKNPPDTRRQRRAAEDRWTGPLFAQRLVRARMSSDDAVAESLRIRNSLLSRFTRTAIDSNGLDNPYMTDDARRVLINAVLRSMPQQKKLPIYSQRKQAA